MNTNDGIGYNRTHKDTLFRMLFGKDKQNALSLYNAVNGTGYTNVDDLEYTTLDDVIYMKMKNDTSFLFDRYLNLDEHQSTYNPNMPLRGLLYFADLYRQIVTDSELLYSGQLLHIPAPKYIVFYNGTKQFEDERFTLRLSDAFEPHGVSDGFEWSATMININHGKNMELMKHCSILEQYSVFIAKIREYRNNMNLEMAIDKAVEYCIQNNILRDFLGKHRREVMNMCLTEFNEEKYGEIKKAEGLAEGRTEGLAEGLVALVQSLKPLVPDFDTLYEIIIKNRAYASYSKETIRKYY